MSRKILVSTLILVAMSSFPAQAAGRNAGERCAPDKDWIPRTPAPTNAALPQGEEGECAFYRWAWQMFLYVTQDVGGSTPRFLSYETQRDLFGTSTTRFFANVANPAMLGLATPMLGLAPRVAKQPSPDLGDINQPFGRGILVDQAGHPIFYAVHVNQIFSQFVRDTGLSDPQKWKKASPKLEFPTGSLQLKSSWQIVKRPSRNFITTRAVVLRMKEENGQIKLDDHSPPTEVTVALLGIHVVGVIQGHPEFVWSTFEHSDRHGPDNAPSAATNPPIDGNDVIKSKGYRLYAAGTKAAEANTPAIQLTLNARKQTLTPTTSIYRVYPGSDPKNSREDEGVASLNSGIAGLFGSQHDLRKHYRLVGAVWINDPNTDFREGERFEDKVLQGEKALSNTTMESFTQSGRDRPNCFRCHMTKETKSVPAMRVNMSHILMQFFAAHP